LLATTVQFFITANAGTEAMECGARLAVQGDNGCEGQGWEYTREMALEAEELGFASVWLPDHVINAPMNKEVPMLENWTVLSALAALIPIRADQKLWADWRSPMDMMRQDSAARRFQAWQQ
jgi:hypothetical protein